MASPDGRSPEVAVRQRVFVLLRPRGPFGRYWVAISAKAPFWRKHILFQRFARRTGSWQTLRKVVLTESGGHEGSGEAVSSATFTARLPKGTLVRAFVPESQARPCYLPGASGQLRTP